MHIVGMGRRVRMYIGATAQWGWSPLYLAIVELLRSEGAAGVTVLRGVAGFGANSRIHTATLIQLSEDLPMVIDWVDTPERVEWLLPRLQAMATEGLITVEEVQIAGYSHRPVRADVPARLRVADVMHRDVVYVYLDTPLKDLVQLLIGRDYRAMLVVDASERVIGIVTYGDLIERGGLTAWLELSVTASREALQQALMALGADGQTAASVMTREVVTIPPDCVIVDAARLMAQRHLKRLPVVDATGHLLGIVSRMDLLRTVAEGYPAPEQQPDPVRPAQLVAEVLRRAIPTVSREASLPEVLDAVVSTRLSRVVVVDEHQRVVGLVTDAELVSCLGEQPGVVTRLMRRVTPVPIINNIKAADLMITKVVTSQPDVPLALALRAMLTHKHNMLPVVDAEGRLIGIADRFDLFQAIA